LNVNKLNVVTPLPSQTIDTANILNKRLIKNAENRQVESQKILNLIQRRMDSKIKDSIKSIVAVGEA
jgi:hypothetical protein